MVGLYSATCVHPEVQVAIPGSLLSTKLDLLVTSLTFAAATNEFLIGDLLARCPGVREDGIGEVIVGRKLDQAEVARPNKL